MSFTHFDEQGSSRMVDVGHKPETLRTATASALLRLSPATMALIRQKSLHKGDVIEIARLAGIMGAKRTSDLIPLCHPLPLTSVELAFDCSREDTLAITATAKVIGRTGVEMEALTAVSCAALTVYDMCKSADRAIIIERIRLESKTGGKSGDFHRGD